MYGWRFCGFSSSFDPHFISTAVEYASCQREKKIRYRLNRTTNITVSIVFIVLTLICNRSFRHYNILVRWGYASVKACADKPHVISLIICVNNIVSIEESSLCHCLLAT